MNLVITARDVGAALHLIEIAKAAQQDHRFNLKIFSQEPAYGYFKKHGLEATLVNLKNTKEKSDKNAEKLLSYAKKHIHSLNLDAILCGLSTPFDGGIDEAVLVDANCNTYVMQDFWGEVNNFFGKSADYYFFLDKEAEDITKKRHDMKGIIIGSPKHACYKKLNLKEIKRQKRVEYSIDKGKTVYGLFGQALSHIDGYKETISAWAEAVKSLDADNAIIYRSHPRESSDEIRKNINLLNSMKIKYIHDDGTEHIENTLLACDVACSFFSNCLYDSTYINRFSDEPMVVPVLLFFDKDLRKYYYMAVNTERLSYLRSEAILSVKTKKDLLPTLKKAADPKIKNMVWEKSQELPDPQNAAQKVLDFLYSNSNLN